MTRRSGAFIVYTLVLAAATLWPRERSGVDTLSLCLICGDRGTADAILNVLLFLPLGLLAPVRRWVPALLLAVLASTAIELLQLAVPGRHPSPGDLVFNTLGAAAGFGLARITRYWVHPSTYLGDRLATIAAILAAATLPVTAWVAEQDLPEPPYRVELTTDRPGLLPYPGTIFGAGIQPLNLRAGPSGQGEAAKRLLEQGALMGVIVEAGPPPPGLAPVLALYDAGGRTVALLGIDSTDLVYRQHTRASRLRLDNPDMRARGALDPVASGDTTQLATGVVRGRRCFLVMETLTCGYGIPGDRGWRFLYAMNGASESTLSGISMAWLALLLFPVGYWARSHLALGLAAAVAAYAWVRAPADVGLLPVPPIELAGIAVGVLLGIVARRLVRRQRRGHG